MLTLSDKTGLCLDVGDSVYYVEDNEIKKGVITRIRIEIDGRVLRNSDSLLWASKLGVQE